MHVSHLSTFRFSGKTECDLKGLHNSVLCKRKRSSFGHFKRYLQELKGTKTSTSLSTTSFVSKKSMQICCQVMCDLRTFVANLLNDEDIESKPACHTKDPSIFGIEFLACDFEIILDVIVESLKNNELQHHDQCDKLFKKAHKLYEIIKFFKKKER